MGYIQVQIYLLVYVTIFSLVLDNIKLYFMSLYFLLFEND